MKEGRKLEYPEKTPCDELQKMPYTSPKIQDPSETETRTIALVAGWESRCANRYTTSRPNKTTEMWCVAVRPDTEPCDVLQQVGLCNGEQQTCDNVDGQAVCRYVM